MVEINWAAEREKKGKQLADDFANYCNDMCHDAEAFITQFCNQHRTLQQSGLQVMFQLIDHCATLYEQGTYDLRNESSYKMCHQIRQLVRDHSDFYEKWWKQPFI